MHNIKTINILVDNESWILKHVQDFIIWCQNSEFEVNFARHQDELVVGDVSFFIGCTKIVSAENLSKSHFNLVVHESELPTGKGFAPVAWQIIEGKSEIPVCLIEASKEADSGAIWLKDKITLTGTELYEEWRELQGSTTINLCRKFLQEYSSLAPRKQTGDETFFPRRTPKDSQLNIHKSLEEQFNLLRTVDNDHFPAFFEYLGRTYKLEISVYE